nr:hypothetical protein [Pseudonocardia acidicola]
MAVALAVILIGAVVGWLVVRGTRPPAPGCQVAGNPVVRLTVEQAENAATIAGVGVKLGMPDHAVTIAVATSLQETGLRNLPGGDRDSAGLFQQRPSQGWGTYAQVSDPVYAATAFYAKLKTEPNWATLALADAAQEVQRSADGAAYAQWEPQARAIAAALTGEAGAALSCHDLTPTAPGGDLVDIAIQELGTARLSGPQPAAHGWTIANWLVAHAARLGLDQVSYNGQTWTAKAGTWASTGAQDGVLSLHQTTTPSP